MQEIINLKNVSEWGYLVNRLLNNREITIEKEKDWVVLMKYYRELSTYFEVMEYKLCIDEMSGFAYIEESENLTQESLSKKQKLSYGSTLLLVLLREYIYKRESENLYENAYIISLEEIRQGMGEFLQEKYNNDEKRVAVEINSTINKVLELGILSEIGNGRYKIHKILKAKLNVDTMEKILKTIQENTEEDEKVPQTEKEV